jgi:predicted branched-subunit amino acid permease
MAESDADSDQDGSSTRWFLRGIMAAVSVPALVLFSAFIGFAGLANEAGVTLPETLFLTAFVWALPGQVILIGGMLSGNSLVASAFAVSLSSIRMMPMVVAIVPEMRTEKTRKWVLYLLSHFVAVTSWVLALQNFRTVPRERRTAFYAGLGPTLILGCLLVIILVYAVAPKLPPAASAGLFLLTPIYFLTSLWGSAREKAVHLGMIFGLAFGPVFHILTPQFDLLGAGLSGGVVAFGIHLFLKRRRAA